MWCNWPKIAGGLRDSNVICESSGSATANAALNGSTAKSRYLALARIERAAGSAAVAAYRPPLSEPIQLDRLIVTERHEVSHALQTRRSMCPLSNVKKSAISILQSRRFCLQSPSPNPPLLVKLPPPGHSTIVHCIYYITL